MFSTFVYQVNKNRLYKITYHNNEIIHGVKKQLLVYFYALCMIYEMLINNNIREHNFPVQ